MEIFQTKVLWVVQVTPSPTQLVGELEDGRFVAIEGYTAQQVRDGGAFIVTELPKDDPNCKRLIQCAIELRLRELVPDVFGPRRN